MIKKDYCITKADIWICEWRVKEGGGRTGYSGGFVVKDWVYKMKGWGYWKNPLRPNILINRYYTSKLSRMQSPHLFPPPAKILLLSPSFHSSPTRPYHLPSPPHFPQTPTSKYIKIELIFCRGQKNQSFTDFFTLYTNPDLLI